MAPAEDAVEDAARKPSLPRRPTGCERERAVPRRRGSRWPSAPTAPRAAGSGALHGRRRSAAAAAPAGGAGSRASRASRSDAGEEPRRHVVNAATIAGQTQTEHRTRRARRAARGRAAPPAVDTRWRGNIERTVPSLPPPSTGLVRLVSRRRFLPGLVTVERERSSSRDQSQRRARAHGAVRSAMPRRGAEDRDPRWIQLVGLPLLLVLALDGGGRGPSRRLPLPRRGADRAAARTRSSAGLGRFWIPRGFAVAIVYLSFAAAVVAILALATVVVDQTKTASNRVDSYFTTVHGQPARTDADRDVDRLQHWLDTHGLKSVKIQSAATAAEADPRRRTSEVHAQGRQLRRGRRDLHRQAALRGVLIGRDLDLHAARHARLAPGSTAGSRRNRARRRCSRGSRRRSPAT